MAASRRQQVSTTRVSGKLVEWRGKFGWIMPSAPINHPEAAKRGGKVFLSHSDVETEIADIGSTVSFLVYSDGSGLGAMHCRSNAGPGVMRTLGKTPVPQMLSHSRGLNLIGAARTPAAMQSRSSSGPVDPVSRQVVWDTPVRGRIVSVKKDIGFIAPSEPIQVSHPLFRGKVYVHKKDMEPGVVLEEGLEVEFIIYADNRGLGAMNVKAHTDEQGRLGTSAASQASRSPAVASVSSKQTPGPRERIEDRQIIGEVVEWKGAFGWILPAEAIEHPEATKRGGKVYVHAKDCIGGARFLPGDLVQFYCYSDHTGLGAEECSKF